MDGTERREPVGFQESMACRETKEKEVKVERPGEKDCQEQPG